MPLQKIIDNYLNHAFVIDESVIAYKKRRFDHNFRAFLPENFDARMLDIGPGLGEFLSLWKDKGYHNIEGIDISSSVVDFCNSHDLRCSLVQSSQQWLQAHPNTYDMISLLDVMEHLPKRDLEEYVSLLYASLKEGGLAVVMVPNAHASEGFLHRYNDITHEIGFTPHVMTQLLSSTDFSAYQIFPFEEYCESDPSINRIRQVRNAYWRLIKTSRRLTHNIESDIITPEFFAVMVKGSRQMPKGETPFEHEDDFPSFDIVVDVMQRNGTSKELIDAVCHIHQGIDLAFQHENRLSSLERDSVELKEIIKGLQRESAELRSDIDSLRTELTNLTAQNEKMRQAIDTTRAEHEQLKQNVDSIQSTWIYRFYMKLASFKFKNRHFGK